MFDFISDQFHKCVLMIAFCCGAWFMAWAWRAWLRVNKPDDYRRQRQRDGAMKGHAMTAAKWVGKKWFK